MSILAAIDTYEWIKRRREAKAKAREEMAIAKSREEGREQGREEIVALLKEHDIELPPEVLRRLNGDAE